MKKNKFMRLASILLVAVLLSTCAISGTFAKYTTTTSGGDSARVAVWDITANTMVGTTFAATYGTTVSSTDNDDVVAPGTNSSYAFAMQGTPEVAYKVTFAIDGTPTDVTLKKGVYNFASLYQDMSVTATADYLPLEWTVTIATTAGTLTDTNASEDARFSANTAKTFASLADIKTALTTVSIAYDPNENCDVTVTIAWAWEFEQTTGTYTNQDKMDTVLGYYIANTDESVTLPFTAEKAAEADPQPGAITSVEYDFSMTATQVN